MMIVSSCKLTKCIIEIVNRWTTLMVLSITHWDSVILFRARFIKLTSVSCARLSFWNCMLLLVATLMLNGGLHLSLVLLVVAMFIWALSEKGFEWNSSRRRCSLRWKACNLCVVLKFMWWYLPYSTHNKALLFFFCLYLRLICFISNLKLSKLIPKIKTAFLVQVFMKKLQKYLNMKIQIIIHCHKLK